MSIKTTLITAGLWILSLGGVYLITRVKFPKKEVITKEVNIPYQVPVYYKDSSGITHAKLEAVEVERDLYKKKLDSLSKVIHTSPKSISSINTIVTGTKAEVKGDSTVYIPKDTSLSFLNVDKYMTMSGLITPHSYNIHVSMIDTLNTVQYTKTHLFKPDETYLDISNTNHYVSILKGKSVVIKAKKPIITIGPYLGYELYPKPHVSGGISIQYPIITIK